MNLIRLKRSFFLRPTLLVAKELLGKYLVYLSPQGTMMGEINEVEAYIGCNDPACHAARGKTKRNAVMFEKGGHAYIYFTYGMYYCLNIVTEREGFPAAVLIRSLIPREGVEIMKKNRKKENDTHLTDGPGKVCQALGLTTQQNGIDMISSDMLYLTEGNKKIPPIQKSERIGIRVGKEKQWRFYYSL
jgi:DNA-3-methyladenine glycosylase